MPKMERIGPAVGAKEPSFESKSQLEELRREWHSDGTTARNRLKFGTIIEGSGTSMAFKQRGDLSRNWRVMAKSCSSAQLCEFESQVRSVGNTQRNRLQFGI